MGFNPNNNKISEGLSKQKESLNPNFHSGMIKSELPKGDKASNKKSYSFTLTPETKVLADRLATEQNFRSTSAFIEELIKSLK